MTPPTFITLGPTGTCHENALLRYMEFQGLTDARVELVGDLLDGVDLVRSRPNAFLVQCSAHPQVHVVTERYRHEVFVVDTFLYPAKEMGLLVRADVETPRSLGVVPAATGYTDPGRWDSMIEEPANPIVARNLLAGKYDAGITLVEFAAEHPKELLILERFGEVDTTWLVYGGRRRFRGDLIGHRIPWLFHDEPEPPVATSPVDAEYAVT
jgi:hypothetical protein